MADSDRDVFAHFLDEPSTPREVALLAYASYAEAKYDWVSHVEARDGRLPTPEQVDRWIRDLSDARLDQIRDTAVETFAEAARAFMAPQIEQERQQAVSGSILAEMRRHNQEVVERVRRTTSFRSTFWPNVFIGIVASVGFAVLVILAGWIFERDPSPFALTKRLEGRGEAPAMPARPPAASPMPPTVSPR